MSLLGIFGIREAYLLAHTLRSLFTITSLPQQDDGVFCYEIKLRLHRDTPPSGDKLGLERERRPTASRINFRDRGDFFASVCRQLFFHLFFRMMIRSSELCTASFFLLFPPRLMHRLSRPASGGVLSFLLASVQAFEAVVVHVKSAVRPCTLRDKSNPQLTIS